MEYALYYRNTSFQSPFNSRISCEVYLSEKLLNSSNSLEMNLVRNTADVQSSSFKFVRASIVATAYVPTIIAVQCIFAACTQFERGEQSFTLYLNDKQIGHPSWLFMRSMLPCRTFSQHSFQSSITAWHKCSLWSRFAKHHWIAQACLAHNFCSGGASSFWACLRPFPMYTKTIPSYSRKWRAGVIQV